MFLAGLQKNSFIDFPGKISCVLYLTGCNFVCPYCHNSELARGEYPERIPLDLAIDFLESRRAMLEGVTITGGEPTLNKDLFSLCRTIKSLGYAVKLDTNGSHPGILREILDLDLVDFVAMDVKAPLNDYTPFCAIPDILEKLTTSIRLIMTAAPAYEFRTTCVVPFIDETAVASIAETIAGAACYVLQTFNRRAVCLDPDFNHRQDPTIFPETMQRLKTIAEPFVGQCKIR